MILAAWRRGLLLMASIMALIAALLAICTIFSLRPPPPSFHTLLSGASHLRILDRYGEPLNATYRNAWNIHNRVALHEVPAFLKTAFILSEDKRFYRHHGPDWKARTAALLANIQAMRPVRGASTITEQTVRMLHPRPRTLWSRWLEGFEAAALEEHFSKDQILEFYLNQVPYAANRRGIAQAARYYFNRDLDTLSKKEMLALAVLVRAPGRMDLWKNPTAVEDGIARLADRLKATGMLSEAETNRLLAERFALESPQLSIHAPEFIRHIKDHPFAAKTGGPQLHTTLHGPLQRRVQALLDQRLAALASYRVHNGAALVVDHRTGEILVWAVAGKGSSETPGRFIDAVTTPRQPGSALKPLLYGLALQKGWSAATVIHDAPLTEWVGRGLHRYQNYSRSFYGPVTLRQALGNSLNIPALKTLQYVGAPDYLDYLHAFGFVSLTRHPDFYGDGLALGNGEVTLYELVRAYAAIANGGVFRPLTAFAGDNAGIAPYQVMPAEIASLLGDILSDPQARQFEFGTHSVLHFPVQTAVKTGTSSDYRDSWAVGFNYRYTVGIWMGNMDEEPTDGLTGSTGPALLLRGIFSELMKQGGARPLPIHRALIRKELCLETKKPPQPEESCTTYSEWFAPNTPPQLPSPPSTAKPEAPPLRIRQPVPGLEIAYDPRLPAKLQAFTFLLEGTVPGDKVVWTLNGQNLTSQEDGEYAWPLKKGHHRLHATLWRQSQRLGRTAEAHFIVK